MTARQTPASSPEWLGSGAQDAESVGAPERFGGTGLWIGKHAADGDLLVFDPAESDPAAERLSFFSMTQLRHRVFPRAVVATNVRELTDELQVARVKKEYADRAELRVVRDKENAVARADAAEKQREQVVAQHERYLAGLGVPYEGVRPTPPDHKPGRRVKCHHCGIAVDDFAGRVCVVCSAVLCSCGACSCGARAARSR